MVSPMRPLLTISTVVPDRNRVSSRRITSGYVASELSTQSPVVDEEPTATILRVSPALIRADVRRSGAPKDMLRLASRQVSAGDGRADGCASAPSGVNTTAASAMPARTRHVACSIRLARNGVIGAKWHCSTPAGPGGKRYDGA